MVGVLAGDESDGGGDGEWGRSSYKNAEVSPGEWDGREDRAYPVNAWPSCPCEPEEADGEPETAYQGGVESMFGWDGCGFAMFARLFEVEDSVAGHMRDDCEDAADQISEEGQPRLGDTEVVDGVED